MKQNVYDNKTFFNEYQKMREGEINANNLIEKPNLRDLIPDITGKRVLDLGCGNGELSVFCLEHGASQVVGIDISQNMINLAKKNTNPKLTFLKLPMEELSTLQGRFDVIVSSLAFHYIKDFEKLIEDIRRHLTDNGILIFSQEHPMATCFIPAKKQTSSKQEIDGKRYYLISDYNNLGKRSKHWFIDDVIKYHRNFQTIVNTLSNNGLKIDKILEPSADAHAIELEPKYKYQTDRPYFLFVKGLVIK